MPRYITPTAPRATRAPVSRRGAKGRNHTAECDRDHAYDSRFGSGKEESVYSPTAAIVCVQAPGRCVSCRRLTDLVNDYCERCRALGANEKRCMNPKTIAAKTAGGVYSASRSPWRKQ